MVSDPRLLRHHVVRFVSQTFVRFAFTGCIGFLTDAGILALLVHVGGLNPYAARALSFPLAVTTTWYINRKITFSARASYNRGREWGRYFVVSVVGGVVNLTVYFLCIYFSDFMLRAPVFALAVASIMALSVNYLGSKHYAFVS